MTRHSIRQVHGVNEVYEVDEVKVYEVDELKAYEVDEVKVYEVDEVDKVRDVDEEWGFLHLLATANPRTINRLAVCG